LRVKPPAADEAGGFVLGVWCGRVFARWLPFVSAHRVFDTPEATPPSIGMALLPPSRDALPPSRFALRRDKPARQAGWPGPPPSRGQALRPGHVRRMSMGSLPSRAPSARARRE
jgi:hypothetical protein